MSDLTLRKPEVEVEAKAAEEAKPAVDPVQQELAALKAEREKFQQEKESMAKQLEDSQRKLSETSAEKATLEAKIQEKVKPQGPDPELGRSVKEALEVAQLDPEKGAEILTELISKTTTNAQRKAVEQALEATQRQSKFQQEFSTYVEQVKAKNQDLADFEPDIARLASEKMQVERKSYQQAIDEAVTEVRKRVDGFLKKKIGDTPAPKGSQAETGGAAPAIEKASNPAPGDTGESAESYVELRKKQFASRL